MPLQMTRRAYPGDSRPDDHDVEHLCLVVRLHALSRLGSVGMLCPSVRLGLACRSATPRPSGSNGLGLG